ncbi:MAG: endonuclease NucS [Patescibacteria group bacterium]
MKNYYRILLGRKSAFAEEAFRDGFIGVGWFGDVDLTNELTESWREFNHVFIPRYLATHPEKTKIAAGLACGMLHTIAKGIKEGDMVLCPDGKGFYHVGEVIGSYEYHPGHELAHRRPVRWLQRLVGREEMSQSLQNSAGSIATVSMLTKYADEIELLIGSTPSMVGSLAAENIEDASAFALEKHLEDFLVQNWSFTELGKNYDIFEEDGEPVGQQYPSDTGPIDVLAISKDKRELLVVELKKGRASDAVVGQIQRYMGYVKDELAEPGQIVRGAIIAFEDDIRVRRALSVTQNIEFYTYSIQFKLDKVAL